MTQPNNLTLLGRSLINSAPSSDAHCIQCIFIKFRQLIYIKSDGHVLVMKLDVFGKCGLVVWLNNDVPVAI